MAPKAAHKLHPISRGLLHGWHVWIWISGPAGKKLWDKPRMKTPPVATHSKPECVCGVSGKMIRNWKPDILKYWWPLLGDKTHVSWAYQRKSLPIEFIFNGTCIPYKPTYNFYKSTDNKSTANKSTRYLDYITWLGSPKVVMNVGVE